MRNLRIIKYAILIGALGLLGAGIYNVVEKQSFLASATETSGTVVAFETESGIRTGTHNTYPIVRFVTSAGNTVQFRSQASLGVGVHRVGGKVPVWYNPANPARAIQGGFSVLWLWPCLVITAGGLVLIGWMVFNFGESAMGVWLRLTGVRVQTRFVGTRQNQHSFINDVHAYNIVSRGTDPKTGKIHEFTSVDVWSDLSRYSYLGPITVHFKRDDPEIHYMDISFISDAKLPALKEPFAIEDSTSGPAAGISLGDAVRDNWGYLVLAPLFGPYVFLLKPALDLPMLLTPIVFFFSLGIAFVPIVRGRASLSFWVLAIGLWMAGAGIAAIFSR